ncbi:VOC family protein [uncultured Roseobacter sp.]|uniref:VOC family protein n=1 Tax=uncultured Roseobacter sp. TaxID=114847 RepID=UPI002635B24F|nr:VOC family protein [uncultured Roseobacter sp.]
MAAMLEHANYTVSDGDATAAWMCDLFGWHIRWKGPSIDGGQSIHVGTDTQYLALYTPGKGTAEKSNSYLTNGGLNHIAVVVDDIDAMERAVTDKGFTAGNHGDYEPGRRFYFHDHDNIEYEVVQYD